MRLLALLACWQMGCQELYCYADGGEIKKARVWERNGRPFVHELVVRERRMCSYPGTRWFEYWYIRD